MDDLHPAAAEDVRRPDENRIADPGGDLSDFFEAVPRGGLRLSDTKALHQGGELSAVLGEVNRSRGGAENPGPRTPTRQRPGERDREIDRRLAAELHDDAIRLLLLDDVQDVLEQERLEVQAGGDIEIRGYGLRIVVCDNRGDAFFPQREDPLDTAVIELDTLADPDGTAPDDQHLATRELLRLSARLVRGIEVGSLRLELPSAGVDHLVCDRWSTPPHRLFRQTGQGRDGLIGEPEPFRIREAWGAGPGSFEVRLDLDEMSDLLDEERVPLRQGGDLLHRKAASEGLCNRKEAFVGGFAQFAQEFVVRPGIRFETHPIDLERADRLQDRLLEGPADRHHFPGALHRRTNPAVDGREFVERPPRDLCDDVVQGGFEGGEGLARDGIRDLVEAQANRNLCGDPGDRVTRRLRREGGRPRDTRLHFHGLV